MRRALVLFMSVLAASAGAPALGAAEPCTDEAGMPSFDRQEVFLRDGEALGSVGGLGLADHVGWDETPPTGSVRNGDGGRYVASRWGEVAFSPNSARLGPTFEGTFDGCLDTLAVDLYLTGYPGETLTELVTGDASYWVRPQLVVDGRSVFNATYTGHRVTTSAAPGEARMFRISFAFTGIDAVMRALPHAFAPRDGVHRVRLTVTPHSVTIDDAVFLYGAADAPSGLVFNKEDPGAGGYRLFEASTRPDPQRPPDSRTCTLPLGDRPVGNVPCPGVRPGALAFVDGAGGCSLNFMFRGREPDGTARRFMGTAGHCVLDGLSEQVWAPGAGPRVHGGSTSAVFANVGQPYGHVVYARWDHLRDFALVELDEGVEASPQMCYWGGPTGLDHNLRPGPVTVRHYGNGIAWSDAVPARSGVALDWRDPDVVQFQGGAAPGDSGSGTITADGLAAGVLVELTTLGNGDGVVGVVRLKPAMDDAVAALGLASLELVTAPLLRP